MKHTFSILGSFILSAALGGCIIAPPPQPRPVAVYRPAPPPYYPPPPRPYYARPPGVTIGVHVN